MFSGCLFRDFAYASTIATLAPCAFTPASLLISGISHDDYITVFKVITMTHKKARYTGGTPASRLKLARVISGRMVIR